MQEDPETLEVELEDLLNKNGVAYKYSTTTKSASFVDEVLDQTLNFVWPNFCQLLLVVVGTEQ